MRSSFDNIKNWINFIRSIENNTLVLCGNKIDLSERKVEKEEGEALAQKEGISFFEVSAKTLEGIKKMFYNSVADLSIFAGDNSNKDNLVKQLLQENEVENFWGEINSQKQNQPPSQNINMNQQMVSVNNNQLIMVEAIFNYEGINITIQCERNEKMKDIIDRFLIKIKYKENNLYYLYNGTKINYELTFNEQANIIDKNRKQMNIIVNKNDEIKIINKEIISKNIICPICKENVLINYDNFKINFHDCKNNHNMIKTLSEFEKTQKIDLNNIICNECNINNKGNTHNNDFYICNTCNINLCPLCKSNHDKNHNIINYEDKNYICRKHKDEKFIITK